MDGHMLSSRWLVAVGIAFAVVYSSFYLFHHAVFNSPDETANYFFIRQFAEEGRLSVPAVLDGELGEMIVPRSMRVVNDHIVPASFLGLILLYGSFASLFGTQALVVIGGIVAALGAWAYYLLVQYIWGRTVAFFSFLVLLLLPAWWYYASLAFFPNILFLTLVLWSLVAALSFSRTHSVTTLILSALLTGLALITRFAAFPWLFALWAVIGGVFYRYTRNRRALYAGALWLAIVVLVLLGLSVMQKQLYGSSLATGYVLSGSAGAQGYVHTPLLLETFFPQGFHPRTAVHIFYQYYLKLFWFLSVPALLGCALFIMQFRRRTFREKLYFGIAALVSLWILFYYGSWQLTDNINTEEVSLGVSYVRYWLPLYLMSIPLAVFGVESAIHWLKLSIVVKRLSVVFLLSVLFLVSFSLTYLDKNDSLIPLHETLTKNVLKKELVLAETEERSVVMTYRQDKLFFPDRAVIHTLNDASVFAKLPALVSRTPVYVYTFLDEEAIQNLIGKPLNEIGLDIEFVAAIFDDTLFRVTNVENSK